MGVEGLLTKIEKEYVVTNCDYLQDLKYSPNLPYVFTEHGVVMLSSVLKSKKAVAVNINIVKAFVRLRELAFSYKDLVRKLWELEDKFVGHDKRIQEIFISDVEREQGKMKRSVILSCRAEELT